MLCTINPIQPHYFLRVNHTDSQMHHMLIKCVDVMDVDKCAKTPTPEFVTKKRSRTSPTLDTPQRNAKRTPLRERALNSILPLKLHFLASA